VNIRFLQKQHLTTAFALLAICVGYIVGVCSLHPTAFFGSTHDDMVYFTTAKALAEHRGFIAPSLPGNPPATKYPILYSWLLSWVWRLNPTFPNNLGTAIEINMLFGLIFILASYLLIRKMQHLSNREALLLTGICALHPGALFYSADLMTEIPFAAMALIGFLLADRSMRRAARFSTPVACGVIFGLTILVRTAGVPLFLGAVLAGIIRRAWRQALVCVASFSPFFIGLFWRSILVVPPSPYGAFSPSTPGWRQAWLYYTDYVAFRKMASPNLHVTGQLLVSQIFYLPSDIAGYFLFPFTENHFLFWFMTTLFIFSAVCVGWARQAEFSSWAPVYLGAMLYILSLMSWDYPSWDRFLLLFLPLLVATVWVQGKAWSKDAISAIRNAPHFIERLGATAALLFLLVTFLCSLWNYFYPSRVWARVTARERGMLLPEKQEAYAWLRRNAPKDETVIAMEDGSVYLYAGLPSMVPIVPSPGGIYDHDVVKTDLDHMMDVAQVTGAKYWLVSSDDYGNTQKFFKPLLNSRTTELRAVLPVAFTSSANHVFIYELACVQEPRLPTCRAAAKVLFPEGLPDHPISSSLESSHSTERERPSSID
jgi:hypothetical protein